MKIAIVGVTGQIGTRLLDEALARGHTVTGISRNPSKLSPRDGLGLVAGDANAPEALAPLLAGHDAVISSIHFTVTDPHKLIGAVRHSGVKRYLVVGGAGSLEVGPGKALVDTADFPAMYYDEANGGRVFLNILRGVDDLEWTMLCPSALFVAGERTGVFRLGEDSLLTATDGKSWISFEDYAIAMLDEIETPKQIRRRFTVGY
ncbi:MAG TPA: NAD(P)-dependent oxidoreductase [Luteibacter sp.]|jgi:putative NADH-flavin reductase|nr:NAD(P)-dependent oxidoreductase [Luteibacter sp.]